MAGAKTAAPGAAGPPFDGGVLLIAGGLMAFGIAMVYSASVTIRGAEFDLSQWWNSPLRQAFFAAGGFFGMLFAAHCDYRWLAWNAPRDFWRPGLPYLAALLLLVVVLFFGYESGGAQRALVILRSPFVLSFQPSELAKVVMVIWLAAYLARLQESRTYLRNRLEPDVRRFRIGFLPVVLSAGPLIALTGLEDFGTAALMGVVLVFMLLLGGARWLHIGGIGLLGALGGAALILHKPYRLQRILTFFSESPDPRGDGYQVDQSLLAIGAGDWYGRGLGAGVQKYGFLPQKDNDFILATTCEELGTVGGLIVIALFVLLMWRGWLITRRTADPFGKLLAAGITLLIGLQAAFNVAVVTNSVPTKGISLPFVSAGGSGVLFLGVAVGILASVGRPQMHSANENGAAGG